MTIIALQGGHQRAPPIGTDDDAGRDVLKRVARARDDWMYAKLKDLEPEELEILRQAADLLSRRVLA